MCFIYLRFLFLSLVIIEYSVVDGDCFGNGVYCEGCKIKGIFDNRKVKLTINSMNFVFSSYFLLYTGNVGAYILVLRLYLLLGFIYCLNFVTFLLLILGVSIRIELISILHCRYFLTICIYIHLHRKSIRLGRYIFNYTESRDESNKKNH